MDFFGIGFGEIALIVFVALLLMGPKKVVEISYKLGQLMRNFRKVTSDFSTQLTNEIENEKPEKHLPPSALKTPEKKA